VELFSGQLDRLGYTQRERTEWILPPQAEPGLAGSASVQEATGQVTLTFTEFDTQHGLCCLPLTFHYTMESTTSTLQCRVE
jgi:hypothetical protein